MQTFENLCNIAALAEISPELAEEQANKLEIDRRDYTLLMLSSYKSNFLEKYPEAG